MVDNATSRIYTGKGWRACNAGGFAYWEVSAGSIPAHVTISNLNIEDMKEFFELMEKDYMSEGFSRKEWVIYGIIAPVVLVIGCVIAEGIARLWEDSAQVVSGGCTLRVIIAPTIRSGIAKSIKQRTTPNEGLCAGEGITRRIKH